MVIISRRETNFFVPESLLQVGSTIVFWEVFVSSQVDVVALLLGPEIHLQPELLQGVVVVGPSENGKA